MYDNKLYQEIKASAKLEELVHSFWTHKNVMDEPQTITIVPDSFFKIIFLVQEECIVKYFMTGLWTEQKEFTIPPNTTSFGCRLKILAPEFLIQKEIASISNDIKPLDLAYLNIETFDLTNFLNVVQQWEDELMKLLLNKPIPKNKLLLSQLLYKTNGALSASEISTQIFWTNRQINRYLNKFIGIPLKRYLNIQKCYEAYLRIQKGKLAPEKNFFDQAHFIREIKKHTGETPKSLFKHQNDRFIQLRNIKE
ncbi:MAG: helix-turn-helix transcriptional regulator [Aureispira sp.]|nr:helix-turn-helix transcriptional regulator [Aureispira sp.]